MKTLIFEGAGWAQAEHNGVGNCRIRTTFLNKKGVQIYFECNGTKPHANSPTYVKRHLFFGWVAHCLEGGSGGKRMALEGHGFEYTKENILKLVNSIELGGEFDAIEVNNDDWCGFTLDGKPEAK